MPRKPMTAREARLQKIRADERDRVRDHKRRVAEQVAALQFEIDRSRSLARQAEELGLDETAAGYRADADAYEGHRRSIAGEVR